MKRRAWIAATAAALFAAVVGWSASRHRVLHFEYWSAPLSQSDYDAMASHPRWRARSLEVDGGLVLRGLERSAADARAPWVVYFPGNSSTQLADSQRFLDALIGDRDWGAVVFAYRGFDGNGGEPDPRALNEDAWRAVAELTRTARCGHDRVHVIGFSLGTAIAAAVSARAAAEPFASTTLLAPLTEIDVRLVRWSWIGAHRYETLPFLAAIPGPALVVHGGADETLPGADARLVAARLGDRGRYVEVPGVGHKGLLEDARAWDAVRRFITDSAR